MPHDAMGSSWQNLKLSIERPYKDDQGNPLAVVQDILPTGEYIYEPQESPGAKLGDNLKRIFLERGYDFFEQDDEERMANKDATKEKVKEVKDAMKSGEDTHASDIKPMSLEELNNMRMELLPQLQTAVGEITQASDVLSLLLSSSGTTRAPSLVSSVFSQPEVPAPSATSSLPRGVLNATSVNKPPPIPSIQSFDAQLVLGGKDEALRKASDLFKSAADSVERGRQFNERYWMDALKIRRKNWSLVPAPLPWDGASMRRNSDKTSKDFLVSYGLETSSSVFRRRAIAQMASYDTSQGPIIFPHRRKVCLRVSLASLGITGTRTVSHNSLKAEDESSLDGLLRSAQREAIEEEIFALLIEDSGKLPTTSVRVSERLIVVEATDLSELQFELVDKDAPSPSQSTSNPAAEAQCDLIYSLLHALLLGFHSYRKKRYLSGLSTRPSDIVNYPPPQMLQPIVDLLQYQLFCERIHTEMSHVVNGLRKAGITTSFHFDPVGENGEDLVRSLSERGSCQVGGQALIRIDNRRTLRFTFRSPSTLTAHLAQAILTISAIPHLIQLLRDETEQCLLQRICDVGTGLSEHKNGTWFVSSDGPEMGRAVGKWDGCVLNFTTSFGAESTILCSVSRLYRIKGQAKVHREEFDTAGPTSLFAWVDDVIQKALTGR